MKGFWIEPIPPGWEFKWEVTNGQYADKFTTLDGALAECKRLNNTIIATVPPGLPRWPHAWPQLD